jgi:ComF family protein
MYICDNCLAKVRKGGFFQGTLSIFRYEGVIRKAIIALKYKYSTEIAKELADICVRNLQLMKSTHNCLLVPIPLHWHRENFRGFNQSAEVGKLVASKMGWKFIPDLLIKKKPTASQVELSVEKRRQNLEGVFSLNSNYKPRSFSNILIFDDVFTTGSTLKEAAKVLKKAGVKKACGLTIAR